jgi:lysophospholipase L1-like esterase
VQNKKTIRIGFIIAGFALIIGLQALSARQSRIDAASIRGQIEAEKAASAGAATESARQTAALRDALESLSDQLNTFGRDSFDPQRHTLTLLRQIRQIGRPFILILGDSITQRAPLPDKVCGYPIINAGISGSRAGNLIPFAESITSQHQPIALIVVAAGVNDAQRTFSTSFGASYRLLIDSLPPTKVVLASLAPVDFSGTDGTNIDPEKYQSVDAAIRSTTLERHLPLIELGNIENFQTLDGIHLTVDSYVKWQAPVIEAIKKAVCD